MAGLTPNFPLDSTALIAFRQRLADDKSQQHDKFYQQVSGARHRRIDVMRPSPTTPTSLRARRAWQSPGAVVQLRSALLQPDRDCRVASLLRNDVCFCGLARKLLYVGQQPIHPR